MLFRIQNASTYFVGTFVADKTQLEGEQQPKDIDTAKKTLIGYVVGTCCRTERLEHENMFRHDQDGSTFSTR
jgi:hypothetical protein